jgi:hypothetical protein
MDEHGLSRERKLHGVAKTGGGDSHFTPSVFYSSKDFQIDYLTSLRAMNLSIDQPITSESQDLLGRGEFIRTLARSLIAEARNPDGSLISRRATGNVVGLTGEWGSGKSSVINVLANYLGTLSRVIVVKFNPWVFKDVEDLLDGFFNELASQFVKTSGSEFRELIQLLDKYRDSIAAGATLLANIAKPSSGKLVSAANTAIPRVRTLSVSETKSDLVKKIAALDLAVVVLIDELDRVEDNEVHAVARMIKAVGDIPSISYLVAYDSKRVARALGRGDLTAGEAYLEKIIQFTVPIRPLLDYEIRKLITDFLNGFDYVFGDKKGQINEEEDKFFNLLSQVVSTPRDVKRIVSSFAALEPMVRGEVFPLDVLGYSYLLVKAPSIREIIAQNLDKVVDDPAEQEMLRRIGAPPVTFESIFGKADERHEKILKWLFPALGKSKRQIFDRDRIQKRRNLIRLLYLGNPPHDVPRRDIEAVWQMSTSDAEKTLREIISTNRLRSFIDRFEDLFTSLNKSFNPTFWPALSKSLVRDHDWIRGPEPQRSVIDDLESALRFNGATSTEASLQSRMAVDALVAQGDLLIVPSLLRTHAFRYGMTNDGERPNVQVIYEKAEVVSLIQSERERYSAAIRDGTQLKRLPDVDLLFLLLNLGIYDRALKDALTAQLDTADAFATFSCLMVPPGYLIGMDALEKIINLDEVKERIQRDFPEEIFEGTHVWVQQSVKRMTRLITTGSERELF